MFEDGAAESADARPIFDEQFRGLPVDRAQHVANQGRRRRHDRPHHDRMLDEAADEHAPWPEKAFELRANPAGRRDLRFLAMSARSEEHTSELQPLMGISYAV